MNISRNDKTCFVDDGANRGPLTMMRVRFHPDRPLLLAQCVDRRLAVWDLDAEPEKVDRRKEPCVVGESVCPHEIGWVRGFDIHPGGKQIATGGSDRTLRLWECRDCRPAEKPLYNVAAHEGWVEAVAFSPDGNALVTVGADRWVKVWDAADLKLKKSLTGHVAYCSDVVFSPDGKQFVTGGEDGMAFVWDTATCVEIRRIEFGSANTQFGQSPRHSGIHRLAISRDGRWLAAAGGESLSVFDLATGEVVAAERNNMDVAFHPSADVLAGGESETKVWAFDAAKFQPLERDNNGKPTAPAGGPGEVITSIKRGEWSLGIGFSADGKQLALGKGDGTVELYDVA